jgi:hypothetical protein
MDINGFREAQSPWFFSQPPETLVDTRAKALAVPPSKKYQPPTQDNRFPGWAGPMDDGRLVTDYRAHCEVNMPTGTQYAGRRFLQRNAEQLMDASRRRQVELTGASLSYDSKTELPPVAYVKCDTFECRMSKGDPRGLGMERTEGCPPLFGTFATSKPSWSKPAAPALTTRFEGGRNTPRGVF